MRVGIIRDLYDDVPVNDEPEVIIADVAHLTSVAIVRLRSILARIRGAGVRLVFLTHENVSRAEAHGRVLDADAMMPAATVSSLLYDRITQLCEETMASPSTAAIKLAAEARRFFVHAFFSGQVPTPELASKGSELIASAIEERGIRDWIKAVKRFDDATHQHCLLVAGLGAAFATSLGLEGMQSYRLTKAALLHDVGKTQIPLAILNKPGPLTKEEMAVMRTHAAIGFDMLSRSGFSEEVLMVVRSHHELLDGSGYPDGLVGDQIPDLVRLVTVCDIYSALIERRPYRAPMSSEKAYAILEGMMGRLDPVLIRAFKPITRAMMT